MAKKQKTARDLEIEQAAFEKYPLNPYASNPNKSRPAFIKGAKWADEHKSKQSLQDRVFEQLQQMVQIADYQPGQEEELKKDGIDTIAEATRAYISELAKAAGYLEKAQVDTFITDLEMMVSYFKRYCTTIFNKTED